MKIVLVLAVFVAAAFAQHHHNALGHLVHQEVIALIKASPGINVDECTAKCDGMFDLIDSGDEQHTDEMCKHACDCEINKTCDQHTTQAHHHTHPPHPTHPTHHPHPTHA